MVGHILLLGSLSTEESMKRQWQIRRTTTLRCPDAQQRWDRAYQSILRGTLKTDQKPTPSVNAKEDYHAGSSIRPGFDLPTGQAPDN
jgi:hypothetical protein